MIKSLIRAYLRKYGNELRTKSEIAKVSQIEVAKKLACSQAIISHLETGHFLPSEKFESKLIELYNNI